MPQSLLECVPRDLPIYTPSAPTADATEPGGTDGPLPASSATARILRQQQARATGGLHGCLLAELRAHPHYAEALALCEARQAKRGGPVRRGLELRASPIFFLLGKAVRERSGFAGVGGAPLTVRDLRRLTPRQPGGSRWVECTLDLPLNEKAERHLSGLCYAAQLWFAVRVEAAELTQPASEQAPFGLPPSLYVRLQHGTQARTSAVVRDTRTPVFGWLSGPLAYSADESLKVQVFMAGARGGYAVAEPETDLLVGQAWLHAPVLPRPREGRWPAVFSLSLGAHVGLVHLSISGPALRATAVRGCTCRCGPCDPPLCGAPPCVPACSIVAARLARGCWSCLTSDECQQTTGVLCCCFLAAAALARPPAPLAASENAAEQALRGHGTAARQSLRALLRASRRGMAGMI